MKLLDTSIFIYAQGGPHLYREPCLLLLARAMDEPTEYTIDVESLQEILHVYSQRGESDRAFRTFDRLLTLFPDPIAIRREEVAAARQVLERHPALSSRDAIHAAVVMVHALEGIVTTDRRLGQVSGLVAFDPLELAR